MATAVYIASTPDATDVIFDGKSTKEVVLVGSAVPGAAPVRIVGSSIANALPVRPVGAQYLTVGDYLTYKHEVLGADANNLLQYLQLNDLSGPQAVDSSGYNRHGTYSGVQFGVDGIGDRNTAVMLNGSSSYININPDGALGSVFNGAAGTLEGWMRVGAAGVWTDGATRRLGLCFVDGSNFASIYKSTANNTIAFDYVAGGTTKSVASTAVGGSLAWVHVALTWDKAADQVKAFINGTQVGTTQTGLGTWAGTLSTTQTLLGALNTTPAQVFNGSLAHWAIWKVALPPSIINGLSTV